MMDITEAGCMTVGMEIIIHLRNIMVVVSVEIHNRQLAYMDGEWESSICFSHQTLFFRTNVFFSCIQIGWGGTNIES